MAAPSFEDFQRRIQELYQRQQYDQAYDLAERNAGAYPEQKPVVNYWRVCMAVRTGRQAEALRTLDETLANGFWYGETLLRKSPSLQPLQNNAQFEKLVERNHEQQIKDQEQLFPLITLRSKGELPGRRASLPAARGAARQRLFGAGLGGFLETGCQRRLAGGHPAV